MCHWAHPFLYDIVIINPVLVIWVTVLFCGWMYILNEIKLKMINNGVVKMANDPFIKTELNYSEITWYRKRWALVLSALFFLPAAIVVAATGDIYAQRKDGVYQYGEKQTFVLSDTDNLNFS